MIVALAGHVDHGKTALIRALTGVETDRLPEEQRRGMTIDLGFAYLHAADGAEIGFVDVPGHERFLPNMLAGVLGVDDALLVIAADDGPMPQTMEHLAILRLTGARRVTAVITKTDLVSPERVADITAETRGLLARHAYADAAIHTVCARTGAGIAALREALLANARAAAAQPPSGGFRMAIDRRFVLPGIGLVVTGTVASGQAAAGDMLVLSPPRLTARVRSLRVQDRAADAARAGDRCALAITGARIDANRVRRGQWVLAPFLHAPTATLDLELRVADGQQLRHDRRAHLHLRTGSDGGRVRTLSGADMREGEAGFIRFALDQPIAALHGDRAVLRDDGTGRIVAGGHVVDPFPPRRRVAREIWRARLAALGQEDAATALGAALDAEGSVDLSRFALARNLDPAAVSLPASARVVGDAAHRVAVSADTAAGLRQRLLGVLADWHQEHPDFAGPGKSALLGRASLQADGVVADALLHDLVTEGAVVRAGAFYRLPDHQPRLASADEALGQRVAAILDAAALRPPRVRELMAELGLSLEETERLMDRLHRFGHLHRVAANRYFLPETITQLAAIAEELSAAQDGFTAGEFNRRSGIGRNLTIQVLEYLDTIGATERSGEVRHSARPA